MIKITPKTIVRAAIWLFLLGGCTQAQRAKAADDSRAALDKACEVRAAEKAMTPLMQDGGR